MMGMSQVSRWNDVTSVGNIETTMTFDRAEQDMFNPAQTSAMGICAMSRNQAIYGGVYPLIEVLYRNFLLDQPVFALSLSRIGPTADTGGTLSLGSHRRGLRFIPLEQDLRYAGLWAIRGQINGISSRMILASGSPFVILPVVVARSIFNAFGLVVEEYGTSSVSLQSLCHATASDTASMKTAFASRVSSVRSRAILHSVCLFSEAHTWPSP
ncbi:hypothetical protein V8E36_006070 [Tilletia maclaganii]